MILVDSSVWVDYFRGASTPQTETLDSLLGVEVIAIGDFILTEALQGFASERDSRTARRLLTSLPTVDLGGHDAALQAAQNFRALRKLGVTARKTIDTIIATYCIKHETPLLFSDCDFEPFVRHLGLKSATRPK